MFKYLSKGLNNNKGFTLVELVVVIAIIAIIALIAVPRLTGVRDSAEIKADQATAKTIENALLMYETEHGKEALETYVTANGSHGGNFTGDGDDDYIGDILGDIGAPQSGGSWTIEFDDGVLEVSFDAQETTDGDS